LKGADDGFEHGVILNRSLLELLSRLRADQINHLLSVMMMIEIIESASYVTNVYDFRRPVFSNILDPAF
jgi:hypothetical protein